MSYRGHKGKFVYRPHCTVSGRNENRKIMPSAPDLGTRHIYTLPSAANLGTRHTPSYAPSGPHHRAHNTPFTHTPPPPAPPRPTVPRCRVDAVEKARCCSEFRRGTAPYRHLRPLPRPSAAPPRLRAYAPTALQDAAQCLCSASPPISANSLAGALCRPARRRIASGHLPRAASPSQAATAAPAA